MLDSEPSAALKPRHPENQGEGLIVSGAEGRPPQALWGPSSRLTIAAVFPLASPTSASLSAVIICSGVCRPLPLLTSL